MTAGSGFKSDGGRSNSKTRYFVHATHAYQPLPFLPFQAFTIMDQNRDGFIDKSDLRDTFAALGKSRNAFTL